VDPNGTMHAMPMSTINHEGNVLVLLLVHRGAAVTTDRKWRCKEITVIWKVYTVFLEKFPEIKISGNWTNWN